MKITAFFTALASMEVSARSLRKGAVIGGNDIIEDVEFWTRMTEAMGSMVSFVTQIVYLPNFKALLN